MKQLRKPENLTSKEGAARDALLRRTLTLAVLFSALVVPFLNDGVLYTVLEYTSNDVALVALNLILRYVVVITRYACTFVSFAAVFTGVMHFGYKSFKTPALIFFIGGVLQFILFRFGSCVFCYEHGLISYQVTDVVSVSFTYFFQATFDLVKNIVLTVICSVFAGKIKDSKKDYEIPDETWIPLGFKQMIKLALFTRKNAFLKISAFSAGIQALHDILSNFFSVTLFQIITDGLPETGLDYAALLSGYALIIPFCLLGFILCSLLCLKFSYKKYHKYT